MAQGGSFPGTRIRGAANMAAIISLMTFVEEMDSFSDGGPTYLNRQTGEFLSLTMDELQMAEALDDDGDDDHDDEIEEEGSEDESPSDSMLESDAERQIRIRNVLLSDDWLQLPSQYEIHEYEIIRAFCEAVTDRMLRADLLDAIHGSGAFSRFKGMLGRRNMLDKWYAYRQQAFCEIARDWLESHEISFTD
jgi:hypothetical protein